MHVGRKRMRSLKIIANTTGIMPLHKNKGRKAQNALRDNDYQGKMLREHFANHLSMADTCMELDEDGHTVTVM